MYTSLCGDVWFKSLVEMGQGQRSHDQNLFHIKTAIQNLSEYFISICNKVILKSSRFYFHIETSKIANNHKKNIIKSFWLKKVPLLLLKFHSAAPKFFGRYGVRFCKEGQLRCYLLTFWRNFNSKGGERLFEPKAFYIGFIYIFFREIICRQPRKFFYVFI